MDKQYRESDLVKFSHLESMNGNLLAAFENIYVGKMVPLSETKKIKEDFVSATCMSHLYVKTKDLEKRVESLESGKILASESSDAIHAVWLLRGILQNKNINEQTVMEGINLDN